MPRQTASIESRPLIEALKEVDCSGSLKQAAERFLRTDLSKVRTTAEMQRLFDGLSAAQQVLGPLNETYRKVLHDMGKTLDSLSNCIEKRKESIYEAVLKIVTRLLELQRANPQTQDLEELHGQLSRLVTCIETFEEPSANEKSENEL